MQSSCCWAVALAGPALLEVSKSPLKGSFPLLCLRTLRVLASTAASYETAEPKAGIQSVLIPETWLQESASETGPVQCSNLFGPVNQAGCLSAGLNALGLGQCVP